MNYEAMQFLPLYQQLNKQPIVNDMKELLFIRVDLDMNRTTGILDFTARKSNKDYLTKEKEWYLSKDLSTQKMFDIAIWNAVKDSSNQVNSNYGYLVYSKGNFNQIEHVVKKLKEDKNTRQAVIIYNRPSIHLEWDDLGSKDFICTFYQHFFIRDNKLDCITSMRSNDCIFGTFNDIPWFEYVYNDVFSRLDGGIEKGTLVFTANSFHCYSRHFSVLDKIASL